MDHSLEIKTLSLLVEVSVRSNLETSLGEHGVVVAPSGIANINRGRSVLHKSVRENSQGTGSRKGLERGDSSAGDIGVVPSEKDSTRSLKECLITINGCILLVESGIIGNSLLSLPDNGEDKWLAILRAVSTNTEVNLVGVLIVFVSNRKREDGVGGGLGNVSELTLSIRLGSLGGDKLFIELS